MLVLKPIDGNNFSNFSSSSKNKMNCIFGIMSSFFKSDLSIEII